MSAIEVVDLPVTPHSLTLEQAILSGLMSDATVFDDVVEVIRDGDFYSPRHALIFRAISALIKQEQPCDAMLVSRWLADSCLLEKAGGNAYLGQMLKDSPATTVNIVAYAERVREYSIQRKLLNAADQIKGLVSSPRGNTTADMLGGAEKLILEIAAHRDGLGGGLPMTGSVAMLEGVLSAMEAGMARGENELSGIDTGFATLNARTDGLQSGDMVVIGARPSMGKTTLAMNFVESALFAQDLPVVVFSMEQPHLQLGQRLLAARSMVPLDKIRRGRFEGGEFMRVQNAMKEIKGRPLIVCDRGGLSPQDMQSVLRRVRRQYGGVGLIMTDYIQKMQIPGFPKNQRNNELGEVSLAMKNMALEYQCPHVVLSQLSKECERRPNKRPMSSDLRDCGGIEQDADIIMMLYRNEVYFPNDDNGKGLAEFIITKNRNGETGTVVTRFLGSLFQFRDIEGCNHVGD